MRSADEFAAIASMVSTLRQPPYQLRSLQQVPRASQTLNADVELEEGAATALTFEETTWDGELFTFPGLLRASPHVLVQSRALSRETALHQLINVTRH
jgi:hypothetical protein